MGREGREGVRGRRGRRGGDEVALEFREPFHALSVSVSTPRAVSDSSREVSEHRDSQQTWNGNIGTTTTRYSTCSRCPIARKTFQRISDQRIQTNKRVQSLVKKFCIQTRTHGSSRETRAHHQLCGARDNKSPHRCRAPRQDQLPNS